MDMLVVLIFGIGLLLFNVYKQTRNDDCFRKIGENVCRDRGLIYSGSIYNTVDNLIVCRNELREKEGIKYKFTREDIERCWK